MGLVSCRTFWHYLIPFFIPCRNVFYNILNSWSSYADWQSSVIVKFITIRGTCFYCWIIIVVDSLCWNMLHYNFNQLILIGLSNITSFSASSMYTLLTVWRQLSCLSLGLITCWPTLLVFHVYLKWFFYHPYYNSLYLFNALLMFFISIFSLDIHTISMKWKQYFVK